MKKIILLFVLITYSVSSIYASDWKIRLIENEMGYMEVQMKCVNAGLTPSSGDPLSGLTFQIYWPTTYSADIDLICTGNAYSIADATGAVQTTGINNWREYYINGAPIACPTDWSTDIWEPITTFKVTIGTGTGDFAVANDGDLGAGLNWQFGTPTATTYHPDVDGGVLGYNYPTIVYNFIWVGGDSSGDRRTAWDRGNNWIDECGNDGDYPEDITAMVWIPDVSVGAGGSGYELSGSRGDPWICNDFVIAPGGVVTVPDLEDAVGAPDNYFNIHGDLVVNGTLNISPLGYVTVTGSTTINSPEAIIIQADENGVGSFIDNGTITYGGSGSAKVQTYLANSAGVGNFDIHLVGPTLDQENYTGAGTGAFLEEFILDDAPTYAYEWDESVPNTADAWVNLNSLKDEIYSAMGIGLSTIDNTNHTLEMTGELITGNVSSPVLTFSNNHYELISNPYPSAVDFDALYTANSGVVNNKFYLWNPAANSWVEYAGGAGGDQFIQVGQGFFVETYAGAGGTFNFTNDERTHSNIAFRETMANILNVKVEGGMEGYQDDIVIRFDEEATSGYDINLEAEFWESQNDDATSLRSITADNLQLAINVLPLESLNNGNMLSIPLVFTCGYNAEYAFTFSDIESFDLGTEIWLEDKLTGGDWISINNQPEYIFNASPEDANDRFVLHFFGPTGTEELAGPTIELYSFGQYAYVRNNTEEAIQEIRIYSLSGALMNQVHTPDQKFLKLWVDDQMAYYVITVITDQQVYTKKLFISK